MDFIIKNVKKKKDTSSTVKVVGYHNGEKVVVNNCHLVIPPFDDMRSPCLFGNLVSVGDIYYYRAAFVTYLRGDWFKVRIK